MCDEELDVMDRPRDLGKSPCNLLIVIYFVSELA
jgi:hypothetical protein